MTKTAFQQIRNKTTLTKEAFENFYRLGESIDIPKGKLLAKPYKIANYVYFLEQGVVRHYFINNKRIEFTKNFIQSPNFLIPSFSSFFLQKPSFIYCEVLSDIKTIRWSYQTLIKFADEHPTFYKFLLKGTTVAFEKKEKKEISLYQNNATQRYLQFLEDFPGLANTIPLHYIASYLIIRPETLSRIRSKLIS